MSCAPVGVFDSGLGGLSVLAQIRRQLASESLLYVADCGYVPYGDRSPDLIRQRSRQIAGFLLAQGAKALVVACNTATAAAINELRSCYDVPIVGMEPAVKPATAATRTGTVGVLATTGTLQSAKFAALLDRFAGDVEVITQPCPGLVECVERGELHAPATRRLLQGYVQPLLAAGCDTLILGCTHYPFLRALLSEMVPPEVVLIDTGAAVARQLGQRLQAAGIRADASCPVQVAFWTTGEVAAMQASLPALWGCAAEVQPLCL